MDGTLGWAGDNAGKGRLVMMDLEGITVVALKQAVAAPYTPAGLPMPARG